VKVISQFLGVWALLIGLLVGKKFSNAHTEDKIVSTYMQDNVRISVVKGAVSILRPSHNFEMLNAPYLYAGRVACIVPRRLFVTGMFSHTLFKLHNNNKTSKDGHFQF
jgi:hypothetical protein